MEYSSWVKKMSFLQMYFGRKIEPDVFKMYWHILKETNESVFDGACGELVRTFVPTATVPVPMIKHFLDAIKAASKKRIPTEHQTYIPAPEETWLPGEKEKLMEQLKHDIEKIGIKI